MSAAQNYVQRQPRYVFQTGDASLVRFAPMETRGVTARAIIRDLSETGMTFTLPITEPFGTLPEEGSPLKVEFPIPGRDQIACFATVTRVEQRTEWIPEWGDRGYHLIALQFRHLPTVHLKEIQRGLEGRITDEHDHAIVQIKRTQAFAFAAVTALLIAAMAVMATPLEAILRLFH